jgi:hypothetical protein
MEEERDSSRARFHSTRLVAPTDGRASETRSSEVQPTLASRKHGGTRPRSPLFSTFCLAPCSTTGAPRPINREVRR